MFRNYLFNGFKRISSQVPYWIVPVAIGVYKFVLSHQQDRSTHFVATSPVDYI